MMDYSDRFLCQRYARIGRTLDAQRIGILVGTKIGQMRMDELMRTKELIESKGREAAVFALANFDPSLVDIHPADASVCTACPRIAIDDALRYKKPMLTPPELEIVLGCGRSTSSTNSTGEPAFLTGSLRQFAPLP